MDDFILNNFATSSFFLHQTHGYRKLSIECRVSFDIRLLTPGRYLLTTWVAATAKYYELERPDMPPQPRVCRIHWRCEGHTTDAALPARNAFANAFTDEVYSMAHHDTNNLYHEDDPEADFFTQGLYDLATSLSASWNLTARSLSNAQHTISRVSDNLYTH